MNDGEMTEEQFVEFIRGWRHAQRGFAELDYECDEWRAGFAFWVQVKAEQQDKPLCH